MAAQPTLVAQISDLHIKAPGELAYAGIDTAAALERCVARLNRLAPRPELVVVSGDLVDSGRPDEYAHVRRLLAPLEIPLALIPGNHDARAAMRAAFPEQLYADTDALNVALALGAIDVLLLDSSVAGEPHGELDADTLAWLERSLAASARRPALLFLHHPPFVTGIRHMDRMNLRNGAALAKMLRGHPRARLIAAGHVHRPILTLFAGIAATVCPAPNQAVDLDLQDCRPPSFAIEALGLHLHAWFPGEAYGDVVTHFVALEPAEGGRQRRSSMNTPIMSAAAMRGEEHWAQKGDVRLFLWEKYAGDRSAPAGIILFVHGSSMASQPTFDLNVPGHPDSSVMEWFAARGYDCWCVDMEGYGRSTKDRDNNAPIAQGADDCFAAATYIRRLRGEHPLLVYGISSGALRAALFAQRHPALVKRLALDAMVWTGEGSPTLAERRKKLPEFQSRNRRPIDRAFVHSIFTRDHPGSAAEPVVDAFADEILKLDDSVPTGTYVDMCAHLPVVDPRQVTVPTLIMRGEYDGIASFADLLAFFEKLPNPDKQFAVMPGIAHASFQQKNYALVYHLLLSFFSQPEPVYRG